MNHTTKMIKATETTAMGAPTAAPTFILFDFGVDTPVVTGVPDEVIAVDDCA